jgi:hypothetical protein
MRENTPYIRTLPTCDGWTSFTARLLDTRAEIMDICFVHLNKRSMLRAAGSLRKLCHDDVDCLKDKFSLSSTGLQLGRSDEFTHLHFNKSLDV